MTPLNLKSHRAIYEGVCTAIKLGEDKIIASPMRVGVHQGSVSPVLFILVLEALSTEFKSGAPLQLFYADDRVLIA